MIVLMLCLLLATGHAVVADVATPAPGGDAAVTLRAKEWFVRLQKADIDRTQLTADMNAGLPPEKAAQLASSLAPFGDIKAFVYLGSTPQGVYTANQYDVECANGALTFTFVLDQSDKVAGMFVKPR